MVPRQLPANGMWVDGVLALAPTSAAVRMLRVMIGDYPLNEPWLGAGLPLNSDWANSDFWCNVEL